MKIATTAMAICLATASFNSQADVLTLDQGRAYSSNYDYGGMGGGRGIGFLSNADFHMTGLGIDLGVISARDDNRLEVYSSTDGHSAAGLLASTTFSLNASNGYQLQALDFTFQKGSYYVINFTNNTGSLGNLGTIYSWEDPGTFVPHNYGPLTVLEGFEGHSPDNGNPLIPHMQLEGSVVSSVPEPSSFALLSAGLVAIGAIRRRAGKNVRSV